MTETVEQLKERAERAVAIASDLQRLKEAVNKTTLALKWNDWNTNNPILSQVLLEAVVKSGLRVEITTTEALLRKLLSPEKSNGEVLEESFASATVNSETGEVIAV